MLSVILAVAVSALMLGADQYTKYLISSKFVLGEGTEFIKGFIDIRYIHNTGGAWGILSGNTWLLLSVSVIVMLILITLFLKFGANSRLMLWGVSLVISGGLGNLIDRVFRDGNVVDFLHFEFFPTFPIFNVADICVVVGAGLLILYFIIDTARDYKKAKCKNEQD